MTIWSYLSVIHDSGVTVAFCVRTRATVMDSKNNGKNRFFTAAN